MAWVDDMSRVEAFCKSMPRTWILPERKNQGEKGLSEFITKVDDVVLKLGIQHGWALTGKDSTYIRPHIVRKVALAAVTERKIQWWSTLTKEAMILASADRERMLAELPCHWSPRDIAHEFGSPPFLLSMWLCLFKPLKSQADCKEWLLAVDVEKWTEMVQAFQKAHGPIPPSPAQVVEFALRQARSR